MHPILFEGYPKHCLIWKADCYFWPSGKLMLEPPKRCRHRGSKVQNECMNTWTLRLGVKFQPLGLFLVVKGLQFHTLGGFRYVMNMSWTCINVSSEDELFLIKPDLCGTFLSVHIMSSLDFIPELFFATGTYLSRQCLSDIQIFYLYWAS